MPLHRLAAALAVAALALAALTLAACGDDRATHGSTSTAPSPSASATIVTSARIAHPTAADEAVVRLSVGGALAPEGSDFRSPPELVVLGDGTVVRPGPQIQVYPGPILPALTQARLDDEGLQAVLAAAEEAGLLDQPPAYDVPPGTPQVADAPATTLDLHAGGGTYHHNAYALDLYPSRPESTPARQTLADYIAQLRDLPALVGGHLSADQKYEPARLGVIARPATPDELASSDEGPAPQTIVWPTAAGNLADSKGKCMEVPASAVAATFATANELSRFSQAGVTYVVYVRAFTPDESCTSFS
jgi:hypothetical protein